jgi:alkanesulfonate monooxygenase SsuD/methylene tetrahydromethanopterin reductase-like flavin-dependent oxidoreductase (luciferase family)
MIETWGFFSLPAPVEADDPEGITPELYKTYYDRAIDVLVQCEEWGFDGLAWAEHHFGMLGLAPSPHLMIAAVAAKTNRIRFTVAGSVLPLHDGRRHAEECGMLSYLTNGRFEPGIAPGAGTIEAVAAGVAAADVRPRYYSGAEILAKSLASTRITHHDAFHNFDDLAIVPRPHLREGQSVWATVLSLDSAAWCAERGYKLVTGWLPTSVAAQLAARYYETADTHGFEATPSMLGLRRRVFVADSDAEAQEKLEASTNMLLKYAGVAFETADPRVLAMVTHPDDTVVGSPETVAEILVEQCRAGGYGVSMAFADYLSFPDYGVYLRSHELIGTQVAPILRRANIERPVFQTGEAETVADEIIRHRDAFTEVKKAGLAAA